jgi:hypothetical protein
VIASGPISIHECWVLVYLVVEVDSQNIFDKGETEHDGTVMPSVGDKFLEPQNFVSLPELGFPPNALRICLAKVEKPSGIVIACAPHETSSKTGKLMSILVL